MFFKGLSGREIGFPSMDLDWFFRTLDYWFFSDRGPVVFHRLADTKKWF